MALVTVGDDAGPAAETETTGELALAAVYLDDNLE
jgi:hypothetical protein